MKKILNVPKVRQLYEHCAPACLSIVLKYYGINISQEKLAKEMNFVKEKGVLPENLVYTAKSYGFKVRPKPFKFPDSIDDVVNIINKDIPPLLVIPSIEHVVVVKGYDKFNKEIYVNDPADPSAESLPNFLFNLSNNYLIIIKK